MSNLVDRIEHYIKKILQENASGFIVIQRSDLASRFECAPSQINYVLSTRFSVERGYVVESRRGGGGYLRIIKLGLDIPEYLEDFTSRSSVITQNDADSIVRRLWEDDLITRREALLIRAVLDRNTLNLPLPERDQMRARLLAAILQTLAREDL
ncbi:MAG TPA: CtsR family transcriptional regulator [Desulfobacteria bacterium]|nr:CtsR family transcriptional regulator [Desulfobacteria bacterium]